jgi:hypothetical protein
VTEIGGHQEAVHVAARELAFFEQAVIERIEMPFTPSKFDA